MMNNKRIIFGLLIIIFLGGCASPSAMLGPAYTLSSTGNVFHAGFTYGSNEMIARYTGKTTIQNIKDISFTKEKNSKNIQKETLESEEFYLLVKSKIDKSSKILNLSNQ